MKIDLENEDLANIDESRCQNSTNTSRQFCNPTINGIKDPNILNKTGKRFGVNTIGFQGINCPSAIFFNQKNNKINNIKLELIKECATNKELDNLFDCENILIEKKFESLCKKYNINYYKINIRLKNLIKQNLNNKKLIKLMKEERKLNLVLDNASIHTSKIVEEVSEILFINLVFLPPYCPFLNPIEDLWKDVKKNIYNTDYSTLEELTELFRNEFEEKVDSQSYYENWLEKFFDINFW